VEAAADRTGLYAASSPFLLRERGEDADEVA